MSLTLLIATIAAAAVPEIPKPVALIGPPVPMAPRDDSKDLWRTPPVAAHLIRRRGPIKSHHAEADLGPGLLALDYSRVRNILKTDEPPRVTASRRLSRWSGAAAYTIALGGGDTLRAATSMQIDRRKPFVAVEGGHWLSSRTMTAGLRWSSAGFSLETGWAGVTSGRVLPRQERLVMLAAGAPIAEEGMRFLAEISPAGQPRLKVGLNLGAMSVDHREALALGAPSGRDTRGAVSLRLGF